MKYDRIAIKTKIMRDALDKRILYPAKLLSYVDGLVDMFENPNAEIYTINEKINKTVNYINGEDILVSRSNFVKLSKNLPDKAFFFLAEEKTNDMFDYLGIVDLVARGELKNVYPVLFESSINPSEYNIYWVAKDISKSAALAPYFKVNMLIGKGWGALEQTKEALTTMVDQDLFDLYIKNLPELEKIRQQQVEDTKKNILLNKKNEDKKQKTTRSKSKLVLLRMRLRKIIQ